MRALPGHPREAGFTLVELLVALAVLGLAAGMLVAATSSGWFALPEREGGTGNDSVVAAQRILRARLERLAPVTRSDSSEPIIDALGDARLFSFVAPPLDRVAPDALQRFRLALTASGDLVLFTASSLDDRIDLKDRALVGWQPIRLLSGVKEMELAYYGPDRFSWAERWQAFWIDRHQPPALIRVRLRFAEGDRRLWPDLIVRPRATVNTACRSQRSSGRCEAV